MTTTEAPRARPTMTYRAMRVSGIRRLTPRMIRVTFTGDDLHEMISAGPDAYIKLFFPLRGQREPVLPPPFNDDGAYSWYRTYLAMADDVRPPMRTYTVRAHRPEEAEMDVDFALHDDTGPATRWVQSAQLGDHVAFMGPHGLYAVPTDADWQLLVGDASALPAIGGIIEGLPRGSRAMAFIEVEDASDEQRFETAGEVDITWVHRGHAPHGEPVLDAVRATEFPPGRPYAWVSGEACLVKFTRRHLVRERGVDKRAITFTGYWRQGRSEEDTGRESIRSAESGAQPDDD